MEQTATTPWGTRIRLTDERWAHVTDEHGEMAGRRYDVLDAVRSPDSVREGSEGELLAMARLPDGKLLVVVYREDAGHGFIITAFLTRRVRSLEKRRQVWP